VIRASRTKADCTQEGFAAAVGIDRSYYGAIERGEHNVTIEMLAVIAAGLRLPPGSCSARQGSKNACRGLMGSSFHATEQVDGRRGPCDYDRARAAAMKGRERIAHDERVTPRR
jgi:transcriptional regulator with XRE-family HTH domain